MVDLIARAMPWAQEAACRDTDEAIIWVTDPSHEKNSPTKTVEKLEICAACPVRVQCLRYSLEASFGEVFGVWGGTTQLERRSFSRVLARSRSRRDSAAAVEEVAAFFEDTLARRLAHWRKLAKETAAFHTRSNTVPTNRARPAFVARKGEQMARRFAEERERAHKATTKPWRR